MPKSFYLGERHNPQLAKPYYKAYGQLSKKEAKKKEECAYGSMTLIEFQTQAGYEAAINVKKDAGFSVKD